MIWRLLLLAWFFTYTGQSSGGVYQLKIGPFPDEKTCERARRQDKLQTPFTSACFWEKDKAR
jgi:hypothetical protein